MSGRLLAGTAKRTRMGRSRLILTSGSVALAAHQIALPNQETSGAPGDRRPDGGVLQVEPGLVDCGLAAGQRRLGRRGIGLGPDRTAAR